MESKGIKYQNAHAILEELTDNIIIYTVSSEASIGYNSDFSGTSGHIKSISKYCLMYLCSFQFQ